MIPLFKVAMTPGAADAVTAVLRSGRLEHGPVAANFETALAERIGNPRVLTLNSGTSGLHLAIDLATRPARGSGVPADDVPGEILSTPLTFEGTNWPILASGRRIRWIDVDPRTLNVDLDDLESKISPACRAIMVVHWAGYPVDLNRLRAIVDRAEVRHGIRPVVIEDCAQAWAATYDGLPLGRHGNVSVFSFGALKPLTCGSGGLIVVPDDEMYDRARLRRWFGIDRQADRTTGDYDVADWGFRFYMNDVAAAIGLANLVAADGLIERSRANAAFFDRELAGVPGLRQTERSPDREPSHWIYPVLIEDRSSFVRKLTDSAIATGIVSRRNDAHSCVASVREHLPGMDWVADRLAYLPVGWWLSEADRDHVVSTIRAGW